MSTSELPESVGRVVASGERQPAQSWLVDGVLASCGLTAIATADPKLRTRLGAAALEALLVGRGEVLGKPVVAPISRAVALVTARRSLDAYRTVDETDRLKVVHLQPRVPSDHDYWTSLREFVSAGEFGLVVVETVQDIESGNASSVPTVVLSGLDCAVLGLYRGNETKPGVGGEAIWNAANIKFWVSPRGQVHAIDGTHLTEPWAIDLDGLASPVAALSQEQERVARTAALAASVGISRDSGTALLALSKNHVPELEAIWGNSKAAAILPALGREKAVWEASFTGAPITFSNDPNF